MELETKLVWKEGTDEEPWPTLEAFVEGTSLGRFETIDDALHSMKEAFIIAIQSSCCEDCAAEYGGEHKRNIRQRWMLDFLKK